MHIPSRIDLEEILAVPQMVRFTISSEDGIRTPTLLIRTSTIQSKYILQLARYKLVLLPISNGWLAYGLEVVDDPENPMLLWSIVERDAELEALQRLSRSPLCSLALFNEAGVNVAFVAARCDFGTESIAPLLKHVKLHPDDDRAGPAEAIAAISAIRSRQDSGLNSWIEGTVVPSAGWKHIQATYITSSLAAPTLDLSQADEGGQQEQLVEWLADGVGPNAIHRSPQVRVSHAKTRELVDVIVTNDLTYLLFESKSLSILGQGVLPNRGKLAKNLTKHIGKAEKQLRGAIRHVAAQKPVFDSKGNELAVPNSPGHAIIVTPDVTLVHESGDPGGQLLSKFYAETDHLLHIVDPTEIVRLIQAALRLVELGDFDRPVDALDAMLGRRFENAVANDIAAIQIVHRFPGDEHRMGRGYDTKID